jgi:hypothetical protein
MKSEGRSTMRRKHIYVGDYVRFSESYLIEWNSERNSRIRDLRDTIFLVTESCRCYSWAYGVGGGGMMFTLKPFLGPLADENLFMGRGESSLELVDPEFVNEALNRCLSLSDKNDLDSL